MKEISKIFTYTKLTTEDDFKDTTWDDWKKDADDITKMIEDVDKFRDELLEYWKTFNIKFFKSQGIWYND